MAESVDMEPSEISSRKENPAENPIATVDNNQIASGCSFIILAIICFAIYLFFSGSKSVNKIENEKFLVSVELNRLMTMTQNIENEKDILNDVIKEWNGSGSAYNHLISKLQSLNDMYIEALNIGDNMLKNSHQAFYNDSAGDDFRSSVIKGLGISSYEQGQISKIFSSPMSNIIVGNNTDSWFVESGTMDKVYDHKKCTISIITENTVIRNIKGERYFVVNGRFSQLAH